MCIRDRVPPSPQGYLASASFHWIEKYRKLGITLRAAVTGYGWQVTGDGLQVPGATNLFFPFADRKVYGKQESSVRVRRTELSLKPA